jgi:hypothetical protein
MRDEQKHLPYFITQCSSFIPLLRFLVSRVLAAAAAEFGKFKALRCRLLILCRRIVTAFAIRTLKHNIITRHGLILKTQDNSLSVVTSPSSAINT